MKIKHILVLGVLVMTMAACSTGVVTYPTPPVPTTASSSGAQATATVANSTAMPTATTAAAGSTLPGGALSNDQMTAILEKSFADYPWQIDFSSTNVSASQPVTGTIVAQSPTRVQATFQQPIEGTMAIISIVVISPTLYVNVTGLPSVVLQAIGLQDGQWTQLTTGQDTLGLANLALAVANPSDLLGGIGYQNLLGQANVGETSFALTGSQEVNGVMCNVYETQVTASGTTTTVQVAVGSDDGRVYQLQSSGPGQTTTTTMSYDSSISVEAPIP